MFPMTITIADQSQLAAVLSSLGMPLAYAQPVAAPANAIVPPPAPTPKTKKTKEAAVKEAPTESAQATVATNGASNTPVPPQGTPLPADVAAQDPTPADPEPSAAPAAPAPVVASVPLADVQAAVLAKVNAKGREPVKALLAEFSAGRASELNPSDFAAFLAKLAEI